MFESLSHLALQQYWWFIISLLAGILVFLMFVQGGQTLIYTLGKTEDERSLLVNSLGRKWEFTFTTLVTFGGAFFASFPLFYSTSFGGAYWVWMLILFAFVIQAVSYEYRSKPKNLLGSRTFETFLFINGALGTILIGTAVGTFFNGANFSVNEYNFSQWESASHGLEAVLNFHNIALGLTVFFLARVLGILYFKNNIFDEALIKRSNKHLIYNAIPFVIFFLVFTIWLLLKEGFAVNPQTQEGYLQKNKYLNNFLEMPIALVLFLIGVVSVLIGIAGSLLKDIKNGIYISGFGTVLTVLCLFLIAGYNNTAFYPAYPFDNEIINNPEMLKEFMQSSLTIRNSSSSHYTLTAMSYASLLVPFVATYIIITWRAINKKQIDKQELSGEDHKY
jgi:cytochrome bd ubiquinol oxidase subunit II